MRAIPVTVQHLKFADHDETRTRNLLIRSQTPYPLGHAVFGCQVAVKGGSLSSATLEDISLVAGEMA